MKRDVIIPAIIAETYDYLESRVRDVRHSVRRVQVDVMDGTYAPTVSWPYVGAEKEVFEANRREDQGLPYWQDVEFEIDLMVLNPEKHLEAWALAGATCILIHVESTDGLEHIVKECFDRRLELALALKPSTDIAVLAPYIERALFVQCMGNDRIGYHGVPLDPTVLKKIRAIKEQWPHTVVGVDIGVSEETLPDLVRAGATRFAAGSAVFGRGDVTDAIARLEKIVEDTRTQG